MEIIAITNDQCQIVAQDWLAKAERVHRQLRPKLPQDYVGRMREVFGSGAEMAVCIKDNAVAGITVFRMQERTHSGREMYCDDLITDQTKRSTGVGHALMQFMETLARARSADCLALDSGSHREQAHKFYFREGMTITSFHFVKPIS